MKSVFVIGPVNMLIIKGVKHEWMPNSVATVNSEFNEQLYPVFTLLKIRTPLFYIFKNAMFMQFLDIWRCILIQNSWTSPERLPRGNRKVAVVEKFNQEPMYRLSATKSGRRREVADRELKQRHFWATDVNRKRGFFSFNMPWQYKFLLLSFLNLNETIWLKIWAKPSSKDEKRPISVDVRHPKTSLFKLPVGEVVGSGGSTVKAQLIKITWLHARLELCQPFLGHKMDQFTGLKCNKRV